jgi:hypothetical protein
MHGTIFLQKPLKSGEAIRLADALIKRGDMRCKSTTPQLPQNTTPSLTAGGANPTNSPSSTPNVPPGPPASLPTLQPDFAQRNSRRQEAGLKLDIQNLRKLPNLFKCGSDDVARPRLSVASISVLPTNGISISKEPKRHELVPEIEKTADDSRKKFNIGAAVNWKHYASKDEALKNDIHALKEVLEANDATATAGLMAFRRQVYEHLAQNEATHRVKEMKESKEQTKKTKEERFTFGEAAQYMRFERLIKRSKIINEKDKPTIDEQITSFKVRVEKEVESEYYKNIEKCCAELLKKHFGIAIPNGLLLELVTELSPGGLGRFMDQRSAEIKSKRDGILEYLAGAPTEMQAFLSGNALPERQIPEHIVKAIEFFEGTLTPEMKAFLEIRKSPDAKLDDNGEAEGGKT